MGSLFLTDLNSKVYSFGANKTDFLFTKKDLGIKLIQREMGVRNKERKNLDKVICISGSTSNWSKFHF